MNTVPWPFGVVLILLILALFGRLNMVYACMCPEAAIHTVHAYRPIAAAPHAVLLLPDMQDLEESVESVDKPVFAIR